VRRDLLAQRTIDLLGELTRFAQWLAADRSDVDDLVQEAATKALASAASLADEGRLKPWLFQILRNAYLDQYRERSARDRLVVLEGGLDDLPDIETHSPDLHGFDRADIERALGKLPEAARSALLLSDLWGFDVAEIAVILDIPVGTVKSRVARARARVVTILTEHDAPARTGRAT